MQPKFPIAFFILLLLGSTSPAQAYIGPGAGFAVISSFLIIFATVILAFLALFIWPFRKVILFLKTHKSKKARNVKRAIIVGLDGLDPQLARQYIEDGHLPNFQALSQHGSFRSLETTLPSISPVAWSSFATGVNPGKHRIFDFYTRNTSNYLPELSSVKIASIRKRIKFWPKKWTPHQSCAVFLRKSTSFWKILGERGIFSSVIRVPISFPPEKFYGCGLSAMCTPDVRGTQGAFTFFSAKEIEKKDHTEGVFVKLHVEGNRFTGKIPGPSTNAEDSGVSATIPFSGEIKNDELVLRIDDIRIPLKKGVYSPWIKLRFRMGRLKKISGIARFLASEISDEPEIYMTPVNIDPEAPFLPISHPFSYCVSLAKINGSFSTLGLSEDTWALNERLIDEDAFLKQAYDIFEERKTQLFDAIEKNQDGFITAVFDTTDRIQHMFFRYLDEKHPANKGKDFLKHRDAIRQLYQRMDEFLGEVVGLLHDGDLLMVMSDHGFKPFFWGVNLNTWLWQNGYLKLKVQAPTDSIWYSDVDWTKTVAFAYGLTGIFLNLKGREKSGIVAPGKEKLSLQREISEKLMALGPPNGGKKPIRNAYLSQDSLKGPYVREAPDILVGYESGYRVSWNSAVGKITDSVFEENTKSWSGDHGIDPKLVPGVLFCNWKITEKNPSIVDIAPTILYQFGIAKPKYQDGKILDLRKPIGELNPN